MADIKKLLESIDRIDEKQSSPKQTNPVAKNAMATVGGGGYGKHKDKKKDEKVGKEKHKRSFMKDLSETAEETKELRKLKESWKNFQKESQNISEGAPELLKAEMPLVRHIERELANYGYKKGTPEYNEMFKHSIAMYRKFGNVDAIKKGVEEATAYDKRGITVSPNRKQFGDTADWQSDPYLDRDMRLASRASKTGSSTRLPSADTLGKKLDPRGLKQTIKSRTGQDAYGNSQYATKTALPEQDVVSRKIGNVDSIDIPVGTIVKVPHNGKMVTGKIVRFDSGHKSGTPFYVVDIGEYGSERVSVHNVKIAEETDYDYYKKGLENEPFYKSVLDNMNDSSEESAEEAMFKVYGMMRKNDDPEAWQSQVDTIIKMYNKVNDIGFGDSPADSLSVREGRPSQEHPLQGHDYHKKSDAELVYIAKDAREAAQAMKGHNPKAEAKYLDQANDSATVRYWRKKNGMPTWYKKMYGHEESQLNELSSDTLKSYDKKAMNTVSNPPQKSWVNRIQGIGRANEKLKKKNSEKLKEYGSGQSTDPNAQTTNPDKQGGVTAPPQNKATNTYTSVQKNSPQTTGTQVNQIDDPDKMINFMRDPQFVNKIKTDKNFAKTLSDVFKNAGYK